MPVGVLALQGGFQRHVDALHRLGVQTRLVRRPDDLAGCDRLILPGGESTTMSRLMEAYGLHQPLREFAAGHPVMGTCAGMILLGRDAGDPRVTPLGLLPYRAARNAYGRQVFSFTRTIKIRLGGLDELYPAVFIRAPQITDLGAELEVLSEVEGHPVAVGLGAHMVLAFHPELSGDDRIHAHWLGLEPITVAAAPTRRAR